MRAPQRVFTPGAGAAPPALTGREREQEVLAQCLADLLGGNAPPHDVALMGPRGNGQDRAAQLVRGRLPRRWSGGRCAAVAKPDTVRAGGGRRVVANVPS